MKRKIIIYIIVGLIVLFVIFGFAKARKVSQTSDMLEFGTPDFQINDKLKDILSIIVSMSVNITLFIPVSNYSKNDFTIRQLKADIYTPAGVLLASQDNPLTTPVIIKPNGQSEIEMPYTVSLQGIVNLIAERRKQNPDQKLVKEVINTWFTEGKIGEKVILKGFVIPEELGGIKVKLNEELEF